MGSPGVYLATANQTCPGGRAGNAYGLENLVDIENMQQTFSEFSQVIGLSTRLLSLPTQKTLIETGGRRVCGELCCTALSPADKCDLARAISSDRMSENPPPALQTCRFGLTAAATPILVEGEPLGLLQVGYVLCKQPTPAWLKRQARICGCEERIYSEAVGAIPVVPEDKIHQALRLLERIAGQAVDAGLKCREAQLATERHERDQRQAAKAERMEALVALAGGVAHDLNNILGPLVGYPELALRKLAKDNPVRRQVQRMGEAAKRAAEMIQDLLTLAKRGRYRMEGVNLNAVVQAYLDSPAFAELKEDNPSITCDVHLDPAVAMINGSPSHLARVIANLIGNACDAMPEGGVLSVVTSRQPLRELPGRHHALAEGGYVSLAVSDNGVGIAAEDLDRIFEPYYSQKKLDATGSGLSLPIVYGIVKDHKGYYDIRSTVGEGTRFTVYFPVSVEVPGEVHVPQPGLTGSEMILVVDDSQDQREMASDMLIGLGYRVHTAANGHEAVAFLSKNKVDLVLLDMIMERDFDGLDTYREIIRYHPSQKAVIVSGYSATERVLHMQQLGAGVYVRKPYTLEVLARGVRGELDRERTPERT